MHETQELVGVTEYRGFCAWLGYLTRDGVVGYGCVMLNMGIRNGRPALVEIGGDVILKNAFGLSRSQ